MEWLIIIGCLISLAGAGCYIRGMLAGRVKPNRATFLLWGLSPIIATCAMADKSGVCWSLLPIYMLGLTPLVILLASFMIKQASWHLGVFDYGCVMFCLLAMVGWHLTKNPLVAFGLSFAADFLAFLPTYRKIWLDPESENLTFYVLASGSLGLGMMAIEDWQFIHYGFHLYLIMGNVSLIMLALARKHQDTLLRWGCRARTSENVELRLV